MGPISGEEESVWVDSFQEKLGNAAYETAATGTLECKTFAERLQMYRDAAEAGHTESRVRWVTHALNSQAVVHAHLLYRAMWEYQFSVAIQGLKHEGAVRKPSCLNLPSSQGRRQ